MAIIDFNSVSGVSTVTATSSIRVGSGVTITSTSIVGVSTVGVTTIFVGTGASISSPATNVLTLGTNNTESVRINSSGNFGLGTNDPQVRLDVRQDSSSTTTMAGIRVQNTNITGDSQSGISFFNYDNFGAKIYTLRTGSPQGVLVFATNNGNGIAESNVIERLRIDSSGRVTTPYQPAFFASSSASSVSTGGIVAYNSVAYNIGSHYDGTTNYRFTAPVSGIYHIGFMLRANNSNTVSGYGQLMLNVNGSASTSGRYLAQSIYGTGVLNSQYASMCANTQLSLSAGDYVDIRNTNTAINFSGNESYFYGILLG